MIARRRLSLLTLSLLALLPGSAPAQEAGTLPDLVRRAEPAVVSLRSYDKAGRAIGIGSGFLATGARVVTNAHVVEGAARVEVYDHRNQLLGVVTYAESLSSRVDLAILPGVSGASATLDAARDEPAVGTPIIVFGAPQGLRNTVSDGLVSAYRELDGKRLMQISAPISEGSSGGPVLNHAGEVVGISVGILTQGQNLNFAVPVSDLRALLTSPPGRLAFPDAGRGGGPTPTQNAAAEPDRPINGLQNLSVVALESWMDGELDSGDARLSSGEYLEGFRMNASRGDVFTALLVSSEIDPYLLVVGSGADGELESLGEDDDGTGRTGALLAFEAVQDGPIGVIVTSYEAGETGAYRLFVAKGDIRSDILELFATDGSPETASERWVEAVTTSDFDAYIDRSSVRRSESGYVEAWIETKYNTFQTLPDGARYDRTLHLHEYDCERRRNRVRSMTLYQAESLIETDTFIGDWMRWVPESVGESTGEAVCQLADL